MVLLKNKKIRTIFKTIIYMCVAAVAYHLTLTSSESPRYLEDAIVWNYIIVGENKESGKIEIIDLFDGIIDDKINRRDIRTHVKSFDNLLTMTNIDHYVFSIDPMTIKDDVLNEQVKVDVSVRGDVLKYTVTASKGDGPICYYYYDVKNGIPYNLRFGIITRGHAYLAIICSFMAIALMFISIKVGLLVIKFISHNRINELFTRDNE